MKISRRAAVISKSTHPEKHQQPALTTWGKMLMLVGVSAVFASLVFHAWWANVDEVLALAGILLIWHGYNTKER